MSIAACADLVRRGDEDRWRAAMAVPDAERGGLMALYAFNLEIARAPWVASEPLLAEIRLQWWKDAIEEIYAGAPPRRHEVVEPLARAIHEADPPRALFIETIEARLRDADPAPFDDLAALEAHVNRTAGHLAVLSAQLLGAGDAALGVVRDYGCGTGLAAFLAALPAYESRGRRPLAPQLTPTAIAERAEARIAQARSRRHLVGAGIMPALLPGVLSAARLRAARRRPGQDVDPADLVLSEFGARSRLAWVALSGRW